MVFRLKTAEHPSFERSGSDLLTNVKITLSEALLGFSRILLTHLDGRGIQVTSPPGKVVTPGYTMKLSGEGMPTFKNPDRKGDLYVVLEVEMPDARWLQSIDQDVRARANHSANIEYMVSQELAKLLPPKKANIEPPPEIVDNAPFEEADLADVRARCFPASSDFFDQAFASQFGGDDGDWEDEDDDDYDDHGLGGEPECRPQ